MRTECLNCNLMITKEGDAFCHKCDGEFFICQGCDNIMSIGSMVNEEECLCEMCNSEN